MRLKVEPRGFDTLRGELQALAGELQVKAVRAGLREAAEPIRQQMVQLAPRRHRGRIAAAMNVMQITRSAGDVLGVDAKNIETGAVAMLVGPNKGGAKRWKYGVSVALWAEFGTMKWRATRWMGKAFDAAGQLDEGRFYAGLQKWLDRSRARGVIS